MHAREAPGPGQVHTEAVHCLQTDLAQSANAFIAAGQKSSANGATCSISSCWPTC